MKKIEQAVAMLPDYGKKRLLTYADSFRDLAQTFLYLPEETQTKEEVDRQDYLFQKRLNENRELLADHLNEMAQIMTKVAEESFCMVKVSDKQLKQINTNLRKQGVILRDLSLMENKKKHLEITVKVKSIKKTTFCVEEIAGLLSVVFNKRLLPAIGSTSFLTSDFQTILFEEESCFGVLTGVARAVKETEKVSGDNYTFLQTSNGQLTVAISDGMGAGEKACKDSSEVVDLLEKLLESGFSKETAVQIINGVLIAGSEQQNMSTLDICDIDLYTGYCEFMKVGSAVTFIKRNNSVEKITANSLPLGVFSHMDTDVIRRQVEDETYIIMLSDGVSDALSLEENIDVFQRMLLKTNVQNPKEIANHILKFALHAGKGVIRDDMTVLVIGVWKNNYA